MTDDQTPLADRDALSDPELIARVRAGDTEAFEALFLRHRDVAHRFALRLAGKERAEDICSESFAKIFDLLQRGKGPDVAFRAYLLTTVRTVHLNQVRAGGKESPVADTDLQSLTEPLADEADARFDEGAIARAFRQLPERWQSTLWLSAVEGVPNEEISRHLGIRSNAVASLAFRARAGLRQAYLAEHLRESADAECNRILELLPGFLRGTLTPRRRHLVEAHLDRCSRCAVAAEELADVDRRLGALLAPLVVGGAAAALWPATVAVPAAPVVSGVVAGLGKSSGFSFLGGLGSAAGSAGVGQVAVAATLAAASIGFSVQAVTGGDDRPVVSPRPPSLAPSTGPASPGRPVAPDPSTPPTPAGTTTRPTPAIAAPASPTVASPATVSGPSPAAGPTGTPTGAPAGTPPAAAARSMAIGDLEATTFRRNTLLWNRVTIPVSDATEDARLVLSTNRTYEARLVTGTGTGWACGKPKVDWATTNGPRSTITCVHTGGSDGTPLQVEYRVDSRSWLTGTLTPPAGVVDPEPADNSATIALVD